jgi:DMSO/TMAO reductase YedYZ molybdopterin-dependent catalytic subunit
MKHNRTITIILSLLVLSSILLAACGSGTPAPVTLTVNGAVNKELQLTDADLHGMSVVTLNLEHPKNGPTDYTGIRLNDLLNEAGIKDGATTVTLTASDGFTNDLDLATVQACTDCLVAFDPETTGVYNAAMSGQSSKAWVKQLVTITVK